MLKIKLTELGEIVLRSSLEGIVPITANIGVRCIERLRLIVSILLKILAILLYVAPSFINHPLRPLDEVYFGRGLLLQSGLSFPFFFQSLDFFLLEDLLRGLLSGCRLVLQARDGSHDGHHGGNMVHIISVELLDVDFLCFFPKIDPVGVHGHLGLGIGHGDQACGCCWRHGRRPRAH